MDSAYVWTVIIGLGLITYVIRFSFLGLLAGRKVPLAVRRALGFVPITVLPAMVMPMVAYAPDGDWAEPHRPLAALAAVVLGAVTRNLVLSILGGIVAFWGLRALGI